MIAYPSRQMLENLPLEQFGLRDRKRKPPVADYSGWTLRPEIAADLGPQAPKVEGMMRAIGPAFGYAPLFEAVMMPPPPPAAELPPMLNRMVAQVPKDKQGGLRNMLLSVGPMIQALGGRRKG